MIIFGTYVLHKVLMAGTFHCPQCAGTTECQVRRGRRWFHIFWIPLIPMGHQPEQVRCLRCKSLWSLSVIGPAGDQFRRIPRVDAAPAGGGIPLAPGPPPPVVGLTTGPPPPAPYLTPVEDSREWAERNGLNRS